MLKGNTVENFSIRYIQNLHNAIFIMSIWKAIVKFLINLKKPNYFRFWHFSFIKIKLLSSWDTNLGREMIDGYDKVYDMQWINHIGDKFLSQKKLLSCQVFFFNFEFFCLWMINHSISLEIHTVRLWKISHSTSCQTNLNLHAYITAIQYILTASEDTTKNITL